MRLIKKFTIIYSLFFVLVGIASVPSVAFADVGQIPAQTSAQKATELKVKAKDSLNQLKYTDAESVIGQGINILMMFMGAIMFALVVYGGGLWMTAGGNNDKITKAKNIIIWAALGVVAMLASYIVVNFIFTQVAG